jgi:hypothetical protein
VNLYTASTRVHQLGFLTAWFNYASGSHQFAHLHPNIVEVHTERYLPDCFVVDSHAIILAGVEPEQVGKSNGDLDTDTRHEICVADDRWTLRCGNQGGQVEKDLRS